MTSLTPTANPLRLQLERSRLHAAMDWAEELAHRRMQLNTPELVRLNFRVNGLVDATDPESVWRDQPITLSLPSGRQQTLSVLADPKGSARDLLLRAQERAEGIATDAAISAMEAGLEVYVELVLSHPFKEGNRRTAAAAAHYFFVRHQIPLSGSVLHDLGVGDLRDPEQKRQLWQTASQVLRFSLQRKS